MGVKFMRKHQQKQILNLIATLSEANAEIKRLFLCGKTSHVLKLLEDCQDGVVQIGEFIESVDGKGTQTVALLEEYHESLYSIAVGIGTADANFVKRLKKQLLQIENSVRREFIQDRIEIAFLPYKASMWDSLESIWLAAKDDPRCDAYVVPIPYFDRLPSGVLGQMKYEGHQYPDYVPVVNYRAYDIEARQPDIIFIHNPYDDGNCITSVHPDYYSDKLKNCTELLCYVPYFVVSNDVQEHFVLCSGVINADRVFIQSKEVRDTYVRICEEFEKEHKCKGSFGNIQSKFIASGSPKFERVLHTKRENYNLPEDWQKLIGNKKVIFYNTSIGAILQGNEQYLEKLRYVLDTFRNRSDVVLWWRPHPLNEATYQSMRPHLFEAYEQIVADFRCGGWGIYDNTPDFHCAIAWTDGYYGDYSSLATLYAATGKPVLIQDEIIAMPGDGFELMFENLYCDEKYFWFTEYRFNSLFKMDKESWEAQLIGTFPNERMYHKRLYSSTAECNGKLYFAPLAASQIAEFTPETNEFRKISFAEPQRIVSNSYNEAKLIKVVAVGNSVYFLPYFYPAIICYDTKTNLVEYFDDWLDGVERLRSSNIAGYFVDYELEGTKLVLPCACADAVVIFDTVTKVSVIYTTPSNDNKYKYHGLCNDGKDYYFVSADGTVVKRKMNSQFEAISKIEFSVGDFQNVAFYPMRYLVEYVWLFPYGKNHAMKINTITNEVTSVDVFNEECKYEGTTQSYLEVKVHNKKFYAMTGRSHRFIEYNPVTGNIRESKIRVSETDCTHIEKMLSVCPLQQPYGSFVVESNIYKLENLLELLNSDYTISVENINHTFDSIGTSIYELVKKEVMQ
jgi:hypothetical protein